MIARSVLFVRYHRTIVRDLLLFRTLIVILHQTYSIAIKMATIPTYLRESFFGVGGGEFLYVRPGRAGANAVWVELPNGLFLHRRDWHLLPVEVARQ